jgi:hypothetical protein
MIEGRGRILCFRGPKIIYDVPSVKVRRQNISDGAPPLNCQIRVSSQQQVEIVGYLYEKFRFGQLERILYRSSQIDCVPVDYLRAQDFRYSLESQPIPVVEISLDPG